MAGRNLLLLAFSLVFYSWGEPQLVVLMLATTAVNYLSGRVIEHSNIQVIKKISLFIGVFFSLAMLIYFKYTAFALDTLLSITGIEIAFATPRLPIGISFYTFQALTYTIDVYRQRTSAQKNPLNVLLYISFFPQLIAGPIVQYGDIAAMLKNRTVNFESFYSGFSRFIIGLSKKVLLANLFGLAITELPTAMGGPISVLGAWVIAVFFALQIYFDFSGYSDMAIGMGRMFGFHFMENFNYPYVSNSISDFWRRCHISLGAFFRDYLYIPLGGNRVGNFRLMLNLLIVWGLTGFWHGASWAFLLWGIYYAVLIIIERMLLASVIRKTPNIIRVLVTLLFVLVGWVIFFYGFTYPIAYTEGVTAGITHIITMFGFGAAPLTDAASIFILKDYLYVLALGILASLPWRTFVQKLTKQGVPTALFLKIGGAVKPLILTALFLLSLSFLVGQTYNPFIYFQF